LALAAITNNDRVGLLIFSDKIEHFITPRKGRNHTLRLIRDLLAARSTNRGTDLSMALRAVNSRLKQRAIVFLLSDFLTPAQDYAHDLLVVSRRHDLIGVVMSDPREENWPDVGIVGLSDAESGATHWVDTSSKKWRSQFEQQTARFRQFRDTTLARAGVDRIDLPANGDYVRALTAFFQQRAQRIKR